MSKTKRLAAGMRINVVMSLCGSGGARIVAALVLALLLHTCVYAYTLVLRSTRCIEIPSNFTVTPATVTYEAATGINVTVQISSIDIAATERANNEAAGSLLRRIAHNASSQQKASDDVLPASSPTRHKLTDQDLEASRRARQLSAEKYERRRAELELPSSTDARRRTAAEAQAAREQLRRSETDEAVDEAYWRARASALRNETVALDAEINYVQSRLAQLPDTLFVSPYAFSAPVVQLGSYPFAYPYGTIFPQGVTNNRNNIITNGGGQLRGRFNVGGGGARVGVSINAGNAGANFQRRVIVAPSFGASTLFYAPSLYSSYGYDASYERAALIERLHQLEQTQAGFQARWRLLEEEARRAGALPGWLRP